MFKKVAITGHSSGIGKGFFDYFKNISEVKGFDLTNGYDIENDPDKIICETLDCDLFINNACVDSTSSQAELARLWGQQHKENPFFIINLSSISVRANISLPQELDSYTIGKRELEKVHTDINLSNYLCKSIILAPGIVETERVKRFDHLTFYIYNRLKEQNSVLTVEDVVNITTKNLELIDERYFPSLIEVYNRKIILP